MRSAAGRCRRRLVTAAMCLLPCFAFAQQDVSDISAVPNRPTISTTAEPVQTGVFEVEYGIEAAMAHQDVNGLLKFGISRNLELRFGNVPFERDSSVAGTGDSSAGFKYRLVEQRKKLPTLSLLYAAILPTAGNGLSSSGYEYSLGLLLSKDFGKHHFDFNEGVQFSGRALHHNFLSALAYSHPLTTKLAWTGELAGANHMDVTPATATGLGALTYSLSPRLVLDGGVSYEVIGRPPHVVFLAGVTYSVANLYHLHRQRQETGE